jgi:hypothetical protein
MQAGVVAAEQHGGRVARDFVERLQQSSRIGEVKLAVHLQWCSSDRRLGLRDKLDGLASPGRRRAEHEIEWVSVELVGDAARDTGQHCYATTCERPIVISTACRRRMGRRFGVPQDEQPMHHHSVVRSVRPLLQEVCATSGAYYWWRVQFGKRSADE